MDGVAVLVGQVGDVGVGADVRQSGLLRQAVRDVDPEPVDAPVQPEPQDVLELGPNLGVFPVQVGLLGREHVQVPGSRAAVRLGDPGPGAAAEVGGPVVGRQFAAPAPAGHEPEAFALGRSGARGQRGPEPDVLVGTVVGDQVDKHPQSVTVRLGDQLLGLGKGAEERVDVAVVGHVVAAVGHRRGVPGVEPQGVHAEFPQIRQCGCGPRRGRRCRPRCRPRSCVRRSGRSRRAATSGSLRLLVR